MIGISLEVDEAVKGSGIGKNLAVADDNMIADSNLTTVEIDDNGFIARLK